MTNDDNKNSKKCLEFICIACDFKCSKKSNYTKHLLTRKHKMMTNDDMKNATSIAVHHSKPIPILADVHTNETKRTPTATSTTKPYSCSCGKSYKHRQGLSVHKRKCSYTADGNNIANMQNNINTTINTSNIDGISGPASHEDMSISDNQLITLVLKQNQELIKHSQDINNKMTEFMKKDCTKTTNNNYNKTFNLNIFLQDDCKDAMNIMDFVNSLKLQMSDLENVGKLGYVNGISDIIVKNLQALDITKRPLHCSDIKREVMYVKDDNQWEREDREKKKLRRAIKHVAHKNSKILNQFKEKYPDCLSNESKKSDQYAKLLVESMGGSEIDNTISENKIIKNIAREVIIDK